MSVFEAIARRGWLAGGAIGLIAAAVAFEVVRPIASGPVGFDTAASVIYFQRIISGRHLEAFITATPKPLLTIVDGTLFAVTHDWRSIAMGSILAYASGVALGAWFGWRIGGPLAGVAAAVAVAGSRALLSDVTLAYAVPIALPLWIGAGLAMTGTQRRPGIAGTALGLATLARLETIAAIGVLGVVLVVRAVDRRRRGMPQERRSWLLLVGLASLSVMAVHDWLLTGDPLFWVSVSARYSAAAPNQVLSPGALLGSLEHRYAITSGLTIAAVVGLFVLGRRRQWIAFGGIVAFAGGIGAFLVALAVRHTYVSGRYFAAIDLALLIAAAIGVGAVVGGIVDLVRRWRRFALINGRSLEISATIIAIAATVVVAWPPAFVSPSFRGGAASQRLLAEHADRALPVVNCLVDAVPGSRVTASDGRSPKGVVLFVPTLERPRFVVDTGVPLDKVGGLSRSSLEPGDRFLTAGRIVIHDRLGDEPAELYTVLEVSRPTTLGGVTLVPQLVDPAGGLWVLWIARTGEGAPPRCG